MSYPQPTLPLTSLPFMTHARVQVKVHFNAEEALAELQRLGQLQEGAGKTEQDEKFSPVPFKDGYAKLKAHWDGLLLRRGDEVVKGFSAA